MPPCPSCAGALAAADLQAAYAIDPTLDPGVTVAVAGAYGYPTLEADLAAYRKLEALPACTSASGCLAIVNQSGAPSPLPEQNADPNDDWTFQIAAAVDMLSAACPHCKILVAEADDDVGDGLFLVNDVAASLGATVVVNSWGSPESGGDDTTEEPHFVHTGVSVFAPTNNQGYEPDTDDPDGLPASSPHVFAVGGTTLTADASPRGFSEVAWSETSSSCSDVFTRPAYQPFSIDASCPGRVMADLSAVADPASSVLVFNAGAESPAAGNAVATALVAGIFAATGHAGADPSFAYANGSAFFDITSGSNGDCRGALCNAGSGWDAPTGVGTPNAAQLVLVP